MFKAEAIVRFLAFLCFGAKQKICRFNMKDEPFHGLSFVLKRQADISKCVLREESGNHIALRASTGLLIIYIAIASVMQAAICTIATS